ncbi:PREDICTED: uncharacterized protein LOC105457921 isoform X2 [Wasmannia auropunctata]|uniref:uncharacterized protein LOC105457921 isoform X2 n=1 Tax=Wasmannia auropunctata TaxID=64793 RepID=UPI0005EDBA9E|nr:PREDICTED: uncharacterized protein LOC105457921 isoform X2 [Wasmannia auropunctata]
MISPLPSYDDELLNSAYANVSLIADKTWTFDPEDPFRKLNHSLWIQSCEVTAKYEEYGDYRPRLVRDVISESRLAKYGNYEYDEQHERMYRPDDGKSSGSVPRHFRSATEAVEPWMLPEVQEHFARLISPSCTRLHREPSAIQILKCNAARRDNEAVACSNFQSDWNESSKKRRQKTSPKGSRKIGLRDELPSAYKSDEGGKAIKMFARHRRYIVETAAEMQLQFRIESDTVRDIWNPEKFQQQQQQQQQQKQQQQLQQLQQQQQQQQQRCHQQSQQSHVARQTHPVAQHHQFYCALQYQPLILRAEYQRKPLLSPSPLPPPPLSLPPVLSAEVPEFFPKSNLPPIAYSLNNGKERKACQLRYFPSLNDRNYQNDYNRSQQETAATVFPNTKMSILPATETNMFRSPQEWIQRMAPPVQLQLTASSSSPLSICTPLQPIHDAAIAHRPLQMYEKFLPYTQPSTTPIPVYQRPVELYQEPMLKRKSQGVDFNNLILLTKNSIKTRRGYTKPTVQQPFLLESRQSLKTSSHNVQVQWFDKDHCAKKTKEVTVNALVSELRSFEEKYEYCREADTGWRTAAESQPQCQQRMSETSFQLKGRIFENESSRCGSKDRFFGNESSRYRPTDTEEKDKRTKRPLYRDVLANASNEAILDNVFEKRYDELEQQAMEQYRNSEESLALKYQELERQAMEQYRNSNTGDENRSMDQDCTDGQRCSEYGHCSPVKRHAGRKGSCFPPITLLKPKGKSLPNVCHGSSLNDSNHQTAIASRSLSALTDGSSKKSKNICKGASGDKIDTSVSVRASSKRLILMSPFERKSDAKQIMKTTELRSICSFSQTRKNVLDYYRTSEIAQNGSGDENITIIQSPSTEVWLSEFWTT